MASEVVKYAPKAVIDELDSFKIAKDSQPRVYELFGCVGLLDNNTTATYKWVYRLGGIPTDREMAVINHYVDIERLQPERETRYYVEIIDDDDIDSKTLVVKGRVHPVNVMGTSDYVPSYEYGINHETAVKAQALYGGTIEEIK